MSMIIAFLVASCGIAGDCEDFWILYEECPEPEPIERYIDPGEIEAIMEARQLRSAVSLEVVELEDGSLVLRATNRGRVPIKTLHVEIVRGEQVELREMKPGPLAPSESFDFLMQGSHHSVRVIHVELLD